MVLQIAFIPSLFKLFLERFNIFILNYNLLESNAKENIYPNDFPRLVSDRHTLVNFWDVVKSLTKCGSLT
jgi:hypothetical protein